MTVLEWEISQTETFVQISHIFYITVNFTFAQISTNLQ